MILVNLFARNVIKKLVSLVIYRYFEAGEFKKQLQFQKNLKNSHKDLLSMYKFLIIPKLHIKFNVINFLQ